MDCASRAGDGDDQTDLLCFSHLRWDFVFQRPQHLLTRAAAAMRVFYVEEPLWRDNCAPHMQERMTPEGVRIVQPILPNGLDWGAYDATMRRLVDGLVECHRILRPLLWFYTPHALAYAGHLGAPATVYDCMDELSAFAGADPALPALERRLMARADLVFTGGHSLFEAKRRHHPAVHEFPSGVDLAHFAPARSNLPDAADQAGLSHPRAGYCGVLDERLDLPLLAAVAALRPEVQWVMVGPVTKIDPATLPQRSNIHYLGPKPYAALPAYLAHWDTALMPFAINAATRFISPTKAPEYLAAGRPVVSTPIPDVLHRYRGLRGVQIASTPAEFAAAVDAALILATETAWRDEADRAMADMSWDATWAAMARLIRQLRSAPKLERRVRYDVTAVGAGPVLAGGPTGAGGLSIPPGRAEVALAAK